MNCTPKAIQGRIGLAALIGVIVMGAAGCAGQPAPVKGLPSSPTPTEPPLPTIWPTITPSPLPPATATPTPVPIPAVWIDPGVPSFVRDTITKTIAANLKTFALAKTEQEAAIQIRLNQGQPIAQVIYAPVMPFPTIADDLSWTAIQQFWAGNARALTGITNDGSAPTLLLPPETRAALESILGKPAPSAAIQQVPATLLADQLWSAKPAAWSIVPFDTLVPRLKVLGVDGITVLDKKTDLSKYPLAVNVGIDGPPAAVDRLRARLGTNSLLTNRDINQMTALIMTGTTALGRTIALKMELNGVLYPDRKIRDILLDHDLLHISNEVSFTSDCPYPQANGTLTFCSDPKYLDLFRDIQVNIVELTGNHNEDWGPEAAKSSLDTYIKKGWKYFGGGYDQIDARRPLTITDHGNNLAFLGCNPVGPEYAWASDGHPGAATCDYPQMETEIQKLRSQGYLPIVTFQYQESYQYDPLPDQARDFMLMSDAGAVIVSGSQAHFAQGFAFNKDGRFIHYGPGNLFFDQMQELGTRQEFADKHIFYQNRYLSTELFTFLLEDYSQPRPMTPDERKQLLQATFDASNWPQ